MAGYHWVRQGTGSNFRGGAATCWKMKQPVFVLRCNVQEKLYTGEVVYFCYGAKYISRDIYIFSCRFAEVQKKVLANVHSLYRSVYQLHTHLKHDSGSLSLGNQPTLNKWTSGKSAKHPVLPDLIVVTSFTAVTAAPLHLTTTVRNRWNKHTHTHVRKPGVNRFSKNLLATSKSQTPEGWQGASITHRDYNAGVTREPQLARSAQYICTNTRICM
jgi:hypothetical protein